MIRNWYTYPAVFTPREKEGYIINFPDFPNCTAQGRTREEGLQAAKKVLGNHIYHLEQSHLPIPDPTPGEKIDVPQGAFLESIEIMMPLVRNEIANAPTSTNVTLPQWLLNLAEKKKISLSETLKEALLEECLGIKPLPQSEKFSKLICS